MTARKAIKKLGEKLNFLGEKLKKVRENHNKTGRLQTGLTDSPFDRSGRWLRDKHVHDQCMTSYIITMKQLLLLIFMALAINATAQIGEPRSQWCIGVGAGLTLNEVTFNPTLQQKYKTSPTAGLVVRYTSEKYFSMICSIQMELNYANLGWKEDILSTTHTRLADTYERNIHYLQVPLLARLGFGREQRGVMGYLVAGPQIGFVLSDSEKYGATWTLKPDGTPDRAYDISGQYGMGIDNRFDYGITAGLGMELSTSIGHFMVEGRYYLGLSDIFANSKKDYFSRSANSTIGLRMTYLFDL